ncbi:histidine kinase [Hahella sp. CCB-MM4]|uniref:CBS domain-containing protein n=1 Tax=Hahella sp. (strain CCB-MM4) TaxID=1926491 RepID=UPI000B9C4FB9|nr:CBS domain-containing protein [Hahella sp. CCB-MM4]OZG70671.1 histidine kinase [Hahella sp. CCB-MM4]
MPLLAKDIMTPHVKSVPETWTMQKFAGFLAENGISGSPVVDARNRIVGIATLSDIADFHLNHVDTNYDNQMTPEEQREARRLRQFIFEEMSRMPVEVRDIMTPILFWVDEDTEVTEVAKRMMEEHLHRIFVKKDGEVVGIITSYDMLKLLAEGQ